MRIVKEKDYNDMQNDYIYTLIIPHYNLPELLERLLLTIPERNDLQVIIIDDCSPRNAEEKLIELKSRFPRFEWLSTPHNGGGGMARNIGLEHAKGKYLIFADADDFFTPGFNSALDKYKHTDVDVIFFSAISLNTETYRNSHRSNVLNNTIDLFLKSANKEDLKYKITAPWCKFISRNLVKANKISFQEVSVYNDMKFSQQVDLVAKTMLADDLAIYCVTERKNSVSAIVNPDKEIEKVKVMIEFYWNYHNRNIKYPLINLLAPTYYHLKKMKAYNHAQQSLDMWENSGVSKSEIKIMLLSFLLKRVKMKLKNLVVSK